MAADPDLAVAERLALRVSIVAAGVLGVVGITVGLIARSQMIVFDGVYAVLGIVLSWMALRALRLVDAGPTVRYPFGREALTPLVIGIQGLVLLAVCVYAAIEAIGTIRDGGSAVSPGPAIAYAIASLAATMAVWWWLRRTARRSEMVAAEAAQWFAGGALGLGMVVGFGAMLAAQGTSWEDPSRYLDPAMVVLTCVVLLPTPLRMIRQAVVELLEGRPPAEVRRPVEQVIESVRSRFDLPEPLVLMTKVGRKLYIEVDFVVSAELTVGHADRVRSELRSRLDELPFDLWLNVELTADESWLS